ncbi:hypothetical protein STVA_38390 [Allostella vacuolata]|nr:hypothetical protein STVA_38390 [Stella vacuolata]
MLTDPPVIAVTCSAKRIPTGPKWASPLGNTLAIFQRCFRSWAAASPAKPPTIAAPATSAAASQPLPRPALDPAFAIVHLSSMTSSETAGAAA